MTLVMTPMVMRTPTRRSEPGKPHSEDSDTEHGNLPPAGGREPSRMYEPGREKQVVVVSGSSGSGSGSGSSCCLAGERR